MITDPFDMHAHAAQHSCCSGRAAAAERGVLVVYRTLLARWEIFTGRWSEGITHCPWCGTELNVERPYDFGF